MQSAAQAYKNVSRQTSSPRDLEANLLLQAAARLQSVHDSWDKERASLDEALLYNRKLWSVFLSDATLYALQVPTRLHLYPPPPVLPLLVSD